MIALPLAGLAGLALYGWICELCIRREIAHRRSTYGTLL